MRPICLLVALAPALLSPSLWAQDNALRDKEAGVEVQLPEALPHGSGTA